MEIGSHDRLEEGALSLESTNGVSRHSSDEEGGALHGRGSSMEQQQQLGAGSIPPGQGWAPGHGGKAAHPQQQLPCWSSSGRTPGTSVHQADMEDARNLVAFSASVGSLPPSSSSSSSSSGHPELQLYEKFNQEMGSAEGSEAQARLSGEGPPEGESHPHPHPHPHPQPPEDLNTLQSALSQARHGQKPPNCNCDGPDCPDYLEWLEKRIKQAANGDEQEVGPCGKRATDAPHHQPHSQQPLSHQHPHPHPHPQVNGGNPPSCPPHLHQQGSSGPHQGPIPCSPAPIPCSPQVLSIAKERNVSLQTAIAIEALTQLSATVPQTGVPPGQASSASLQHHNHHHHPHPHSHPQHLPPHTHPQHATRLVPSSPGPLSSRSQSVPPGLYPNQQAPVSWEQHRPQSQGQPPHTSPLPSSTSPFPGQGHPQASSPHPHPHSQQWQQAPGAGGDQRNHWMTSSDPMSELKQLLGDSSGKYINGPFKLPVHHHSHHHSHNEKGMMPRIKQEADSSEYNGSACASMSRYGLLNGQPPQRQYPPLSPGSAAIRHSTQAALQQHLHHKRNLFSNVVPVPGLCLPQRPQQGCQNLRKWWPQVGPEGLPPVAIKQEPKEPKEPKRKKSTQNSPLLKQHPMGGMLMQGPPLPKPKQIVIKKTKQKASLPTFLPHSQISIQKPSPLTVDNRALAALPSLFHPGSLPSLPLLAHPPTQAAAGLPAPAQSQESLLINTSIAPTSAAPADSTTPQPLPVAPSRVEKESPLAISATTPQTFSASPSTTSLLPGLTSLDPKFEELMCQFEAEFPSPSEALEQTSIAQPVASESEPNTNSGQVRPATPSSAPSAPPPSTTAPPPPADQEETMEVGNNNESGSASEAANAQPSTESPTEEPPEGALPLSLHQETLLEQQQHQHRMLEDPFTMPLSKRMKIESSGGLTVLSTTACFPSDGGGFDTPTKDGFPSEPSLRGFLESPFSYLDTPTKSLLDTPAKNAQAEFPLCDCVEQILEKDEGPYYNHLGSGPTVASIRELMETRYGEKGEAVRIEKVLYTGREGKSSQGCPIAKWVIRRSCEAEKLMCLVRHRTGHHCANAHIIILIMAWEGVPRMLGDKLYHEVSTTLTKFGNPTTRRCGLNDDRTCACQGKDPDRCGASFSFGCSWSMYFNGCKYARSKIPRKFRLQGERPEEEDHLRDNFQELATKLAPLYKQLAPQAYSNQCQNESTAPDCRLGLEEGRPFSGVTACMDFCAHAHKDQHNLYNGCTVVCTLTKEDNRKVGEIPEDEQLHVLPLYKVSLTDEHGSEEGQRQKMKSGAIQVLENFRRAVRKLPEPAKSCRQRRLEAKKAASEKKKGKQQDKAATVGETPEKATVVKTEVQHAGSPCPQQGNNKAIPKQEVKPTIKKEPVERLQPFNGALYNYPALGGHQAQADPYNVYSYPGYYARGPGLPSNGQPPAPGPGPGPGPVNGYHPNLPALPYGYYNYPPNALLPPELLGYEGRNGSWPKTGPGAKATPPPVDQKPDVQSLQARLAHSYPSHPEQQHGDAANQRSSANPHKPDFSQSRPPSASSEASHRGTPVIKQEPMDVPVYEGTGSTTPQPEAWPGHKPNGSMMANSWDGNPKPGPPDSPFTPAKQQFHQRPLQSSPYPQQHQQQQWNSYPGPNTPMASPAPSPSPSLKVAPSPSPSPSPSPHPGTPRHWESPAPSPQPKTWPMGYGNPAGGFPDKMWPKAGESRGSTPLGLQENAWKSCGGSMAGSNPSPAPEGRLFPDALQQSDAQACWDPNRTESDAESQKGHDHCDEDGWSDSEHNFLDPNIGGVAVAPAHGSILIECARRELHATTPLKRPDRSHPTRISLVFYQHKNLNQPVHGLALWEAKMKLHAERARQRQQEAALLGLSQEEIKAYGKKRKYGAAAAGAMASPGPGQTKDKREGPVTRHGPTMHTTSTVTVSPYAFTQVTGPYSHFV